MSEFLNFNKCFFLFTLFFLLITGIYAVPEQKGYFSDATGKFGVLEAEIEQLCTELEQNTTCELFVLVIDSPGEQTIENYGYSVLSCWAKANYSYSIVFVCAVESRELFLYAGRELYNLFTDQRKANFLSEYAEPYFEEENWESGIRETVHAVSGYLSDNFDVSERDYKKITETIYSILDNIYLIVLWGFFILNIILFLIKKFINIPLFIMEIILSVTAVIYSGFNTPVYNTPDLYGWLCAALIVYIIQFGFSRDHKCAKCGGYMSSSFNKSNITKESWEESALKIFECRSCGYSTIKSSIWTNKAVTLMSEEKSKSKRPNNSSSFGGKSSGGKGIIIYF
jgi:uncharacterized membrane protein YgcG